ncbi:MAG: hypothetical protein ACRDJU_12495 [Actinomycetota bacterium]
MQTLPLIYFRAGSGETVAVPLLVGTASFDATLGYAVPPGRWAMDVVVDLGDRGRFRTPPLPVVVTV